MSSSMDWQCAPLDRASRPPEPGPANRPNQHVPSRRLLAACHTAHSSPGTEPYLSCFQPGHPRRPTVAQSLRPVVVLFVPSLKCDTWGSRTPNAEHVAKKILNQCRGRNSVHFYCTRRLLLEASKQASTFSIMGRVVSPRPDSIRFPACVPPTMRNRLCSFLSASDLRRAFTFTSRHKKLLIATTRATGVLIAASERFRMLQAHQSNLISQEGHGNGHSAKCPGDHAGLHAVCL